MRATLNSQVCVTQTPPPCAPGHPESTRSGTNGWRLGWSWLLVAAGGVLAGAVLYWYEPGRYGFYPVCLFHQTTGLLCPGCGSLRAVHQLLHGHVAAAFSLNPPLVASLPLCAWFGAVLVWRKARGQPVSLALRPRWVWLLLAVVLGFSVWRNLL